MSSIADQLYLILAYHVPVGDFVNMFVIAKHCTSLQQASKVQEEAE